MRKKNMLRSCGLIVGVTVVSIHFLMGAPVAIGADTPAYKFSLTGEVVNKEVLAGSPALLRFTLRNDSKVAANVCTGAFREAIVTGPAGQKLVTGKLDAYTYDPVENCRATLQPGETHQQWVLVFLGRSDERPKDVGPIFKQKGPWRVQCGRLGLVEWERGQYGEKRLIKESNMEVRSDEVIVNVVEAAGGVTAWEVILDLSEKAMDEGGELLLLPAGPNACQKAQKMLSEATEKALGRIVRECKDPLSVYLTKNALARAYVGRVRHAYEVELHTLILPEKKGEDGAAKKEDPLDYPKAYLAAMKGTDGRNLHALQREAMKIATTKEAGTIDKLNAILGSDFAEEFIPPYKEERREYALWGMIWKGDLKKARETCEQLSKGDDSLSGTARGILENWHIYSDSVK